MRETERGILLARFSGGVPNHKLDFSGVAKNSFYVEDGEVRYPLIETMVSGNFQDLLKNIRAVSSESIDFGAGEFPYLAASGSRSRGRDRRLSQVRYGADSRSATRTAFSRPDSSSVRRNSLIDCRFNRNCSVVLKCRAGCSAVPASPLAGDSWSS